MSRRQAFIDFVVEWCEDDSHGYSQVNRWGPDDCDCYSLLAMAANHAGYDVPVGYGYTGVEVEYFTNAGWTAVPFDGNVWDCEAGEIMVNVANHTEAVVASGRFGGAHIDENGDIVGRTSGDQTGNEVSLCGAYIPSFGWDYVLIPPAEDGDEQPQEYEEQSQDAHEYRVYTKESGWLDWMRGTTCTCPDDCRDDFAGIEGQWIYGMEANFPFKVVLMDGTETDWVTQWQGMDQAMRGVKIEGMDYQVHAAGANWLKVEHGTDDDGAGDDVHAVDMVRVW